MPEPAATPAFTEAGGAFDGSATVTLATASPAAVIRYTLDGTTPTATHGSIYTQAFALAETATVRAVAYGPGYAPSTTASAFFVIRDGLASWRSQMGLASDGSQDEGNPSGDGVSNLLKFAFNLASQPADLGKPNASVLAADGSAGLPRMELDEEGRLTLTFVRRKAASRPGITYAVEASSDLVTWTKLGFAAASVTSLDAAWERVTVTDSTGGTRRFGRVKVLTLPSYVNDFSSGPGAASLRGHAIWTSQGIQLTDETGGGQQGAVVLDGPVTGSGMSGFTARFTLNLGPAGHVNPADGVAFSVGDLGTGTWREDGPGTARNLTISFDTYNNGGDGSIGVRIFRDGTAVAHNPTNPFTNGVTVPVEVRYDATAGVSVVFNGVTLFTDVALPGFTLPEDGRFGFSARTGGSTERAVVDDVVIFPH
ncbi:chitobiase/beta-hexosaminidase C-terminal domain-containing protein [Luteolibacter flavescens]|uniref:chitobiase/beta-hexosaminidase C-terminal domain-containing protein n=1 Tax=Luteolibacter flavescens TaxID=1859460 RepID=UPI003CCCC7A7